MNKFHKKIILTSLLLIILLTGCVNGKRYEKSIAWLGPLNDADGNMVLPLNADIKLITVREDLKDEMYDSLNDTVIFYHKLFDAHHYYEEDGELISNLRVINDSYGSEESIRTDHALIEALKESIDLASLTDGYFNPTVGILSEIWNDRFNKQYNDDPKQEDIDKALGCVIPTDKLKEIIEIDETNDTVTLHRYESCEDKVVIDLGAFCKGYVLDKAYEELKKYGSSFLIDGGSSSVISYVAEDEDIAWTIGIRKPDDESVLYGFEDKNISLSTSGDDEKYFLTDMDGQQLRRHHILDPYTGYSKNCFRTITLLSDSHAGVLDALSTALFNIEDIDKQNDIIRKVSSCYDMHIKKCIVREEDGKLHLLIDKSFNDILLKDLESLDIYDKTIIE